MNMTQKAFSLLKLKFECPTFHTLTVRWVLRSHWSLSKLKNKQLSPFRWDSSRISRSSKSLMRKSRNAANRCMCTVCVWRNRATCILERSTGSRKKPARCLYVRVCQCVIACLKEHAGELQDLAARNLQPVLGSTKSEALTFTSQTLDLNMFSLRFLGTKPEVNESALSQSF